MSANARIADTFDEIASLLELAGEKNLFRIRAYRRAAMRLRGLTENVAKIAARKKLDEIPGIGPDLAAKIEEYLAGGRIALREKLARDTPAFLLTMLEIPGFSPKAARAVWRRLRPTGLDQLKAMARKGALHGLPGLPDSAEERIIRGIENFEREHRAA